MAQMSEPETKMNKHNDFVHNLNHTFFTSQKMILLRREVRRVRKKNRGRKRNRRERKRVNKTNF
jgi:hypothetical protein